MAQLSSFIIFLQVCEKAYPDSLGPHIAGKEHFRKLWWKIHEAPKQAANSVFAALRRIFAELARDAVLAVRSVRSGEIPAAK